MKTERDILLEIIEMQERNFGYGIKTHTKLIGLCVEAKEIVKNSSLATVVCSANKCMACEVEIKKDEGLLFCADCGL